MRLFECHYPSRCALCLNPSVDLNPYGVRILSWLLLVHCNEEWGWWRCSLRDKVSHTDRFFCYAFDKETRVYKTGLNLVCVWPTVTGFPPSISAYDRKRGHMHLLIPPRIALLDAFYIFDVTLPGTV